MNNYGRETGVASSVGTHDSSPHVQGRGDSLFFFVGRARRRALPWNRDWSIALICGSHNTSGAQLNKVRLGLRLRRGRQLRGLLLHSLDK